jgi:hypothetical protein
MPPTDQAVAVEELPHLASTVRFACLLMEDAHPRDEGLIGLLAGTDGSVLPGIEPTPTDLQHSTHGRHAKLPVMGLHEAVLHRDSLAKYAAAFFKMSRSSVTRASSRFSRATSVVRSLRAPGPGNAVFPRVRSSVCH